MSFGEKDDGTAVLDAIPISDAAYIVTQKAIYVVKLADQIDPDRTNINIPNTQQLFAPAGSESDIVALTLLSAGQLFTKAYFPDAKVRDAVISIAADIMIELLAAQKILEQLVAAEDKQIEAVKAANDSTRLPAVPDVIARAKTFIQKSEHALQAIFRLPTLFYGRQMKAAGMWPDAFTKALEGEFDANDMIVGFAREIAEFARQLRNIRHCVEHPKVDQRIVVRDFHLHTDGTISRPTIEVVNSKTPLDEGDLTTFMSVWIASLANITESMLLHLAGKNHAALGNFPVGVGIIPEDQRRMPKVRAGYLINIGGNWQRLG